MMISPSPDLSKLTNLHTHSTVWLFPGLGVWEQESRAWSLRIAGAVFRPSIVRLPKRLQVRLLRKAMDVPLEALDSPIFQERISPFIGAPHRGRRVTLEIAGQLYRMPRKSRRNGHFHGKFQMPTPDGESQGPAWVDVATWRDEGPQATLGGRVQLLRPQGVSVVSDIDDTIKETGVGCRRTLLANTFLHEFSAVGGMAERYRQWESQGASFHYVSSSPWQLFAPLDRWRAEAGLPEGSFHLRLFRLGDHMLRRLMRVRRHGKSRVIRQLMRLYPQRKFVLIGDSSEMDPEIYGMLARRRPQQVVGIYIRQMHHNPVDASRAEKAFRQLPSRQWHCYESPEELPQELGLL